MSFLSVGAAERELPPLWAASALRMAGLILVAIEVFDPVADLSMLIQRILTCSESTFE
jgi:hypothetical protein